MRIPYFFRLIRTDAELKSMPLSKKARERLENMVGGWKDRVKRRFRLSTGALEQAVQLVTRRKLIGDYVEFGVFTGRTTIRAYHFFKKYAPGRSLRILAFDSFEGLPDIESTDHVRYKDFTPGTMSCSEEEYLRNCTRYGVPAEYIVPVKGFYQDTCNDVTAQKVSLKTISLAMIDCDFFSSTYTALNFLTNFLEDGSVLVFDDWNCYRSHPQLGQRGAFARWASENPQLIVVPNIDSPVGQASFSVYRRLNVDELEEMRGNGAHK